LLTRKSLKLHKEIEESYQTQANTTWRISYQFFSGRETLWCRTASLSTTFKRETNQFSPMKDFQSPSPHSSQNETTW